MRGIENERIFWNDCWCWRCGSGRRGVSVMENTKALIECLENSVSDYGRFFMISVSPSVDVDDYYDVTINTYGLTEDYFFYAKVKDGVCIMDYYEDNWHPITPVNLYTWLWITEAHRNVE